MPPSGAALPAESEDTLRTLDESVGRGCELTIANSIWSQERAPLRADFVDRITRTFRGAVNVVDFCRAAEIARASINHWVEENTRRRVRDLIAPGSLNADTRLVLANAIFFKGQWAKPFKENATRNEPFWLDDGDEVQAPLMHAEITASHVQQSGFQAVELNYGDCDLSLLVLLPDTKDGLPELEARFSRRMIDDCIANMRNREVILSLPRFRMTWGAMDLRERLCALGMPLAFGTAADFSGINGCQPPDEASLFVTSVLHKAFVEVNEEGTEAAAATSVIVLTLSMPPSPVPVFRADHPFLFAIRDRRRGAILFLGRMADPTREH